MGNPAALSFRSARQLIGAILVLWVTGGLWAEDPAPRAANAKKPGLSLPNYQVSVLPANIAPTRLTQPQPGIQVHGSPRQSVGHPCTLLDKEDVAALKTAITTNPDAIKAFDKLKKTADARVSQPLGVPVAQKGADGNWLFPGDLPEFAGKKYYRVSGDNVTAMGDLAMMYQLTDNPAYGDFCKKMLLAYAENFPNYGHPPFQGKPWTTKAYRSATDGRVTGQFLEDGFWLARAAYAYDMIYELPGWTPEERAQVRDGLLKPLAAIFSDTAQSPPDYLSQPHNRSAIVADAVLMAGYASEDETLINNALYGTGGTKEDPKGGMMGVHFSEKCLLPDGLWVEGAPAYQVGIAACAIFNAAETLWHHNIDMYSHNNGALKRFLDSAIALAYPNPNLRVAALHDSGPFELLDHRDWFNNEAGGPYECGYRRYQEPNYLPIIKNATKTLSMTIHAGPVSLFYDLPAETAAPRAVENVNFYSVGYGVLRTPTPTGGNQVIMEYGVSGSHSHPSKLALDVYALGDQAMPMPGVIFPYGDPLDITWYQVTMGNNACLSTRPRRSTPASAGNSPRNCPTPMRRNWSSRPAGSSACSARGRTR